MLTIVLLTIVNCLGVRAGSRVQSILMLLKIGAIATLICAGLFLIAFTSSLLRIPSWIAAVDRSCHGDWRSHGPGAVCVWRLADRKLHRRGN